MEFLLLLLFFFFFFVWLWWIWIVAGGSDGGCMQWLWYGWVDVVASGATLRKRETERERGRIKNDKERIY